MMSLSMNSRRQENIRQLMEITTVLSTLIYLCMTSFKTTSNRRKQKSRRLKMSAKELL
jgi:hypothetical protein